MSNNRTKSVDLELQRLNRQISLKSDVDQWRALFRKMDVDGNGKVSFSELKKQLKLANKENAKNDARLFLRKADTNEDGLLDEDEFINAIQQSKDDRSLFQRTAHAYVAHIVAPIKKSDITEPDGDYEEEYACCPPPLGMIILSVLEIIAFVYDAAVQVDGHSLSFSEVTAALIYDPHRRAEAWRFLSYMFVHNGVFHLIVNLLVQIMLGIPLEMVHKWWRVILIYLAGVVAGSLGTSISDPSVYLAGASGGVYAVMTAHVATIILNWSEMKFAIAQLAVFLLIASVDVGTAIYNRYLIDSEESKTIGYVAHLAGAIAGLLVGINVLRNLEVKDWERKLWWVAIVIYSILMLTAIIWNIAYPSYFPKQFI